MLARRRLRNERPPPQAQRVVGPHEPQDPLGVDDEALRPQPVGDPSVAFVAVAQRQALDEVAHLRVVTQRELRFEPAVVARPRQAGQPHEKLHAGSRRSGRFALRSFARHFFDDGEEMGAAPLRLVASHDRKVS